MNTIAKDQAVSIFFNEDGEPIGLIFFSQKSRERVIYTIERASEDEIINLMLSKDLKIK